MKTIVCSREEAIRAAAQKALSLIEGKPEAVLALSAGEDELELYRALVRLSAERGISLSGLRLFAACELEGLEKDAPQSVYARLKTCFVEEGGASEARLFAPDGADCASYDRALAEAGGVDLAILGLGVNARVAFNEPATQYDTYTHVQKLTKTTRASLSPAFGAGEELPERGVTLGFQNLCAAREILVIALGEEKRRAVFHMLYGRDDSIYPAAFLQLPLHVSLFADESAAADL